MEYRSCGTLSSEKGYFLEEVKHWKIWVLIIVETCCMGFSKKIGWDLTKILKFYHNICLYLENILKIPLTS